jgi:carbonic anhydrase
MIVLHVVRLIGFVCIAACHKHKYHQHHAHHWSYKGNTGPSTWSEDFPICGKKQQSPINIITSDVETANEVNNAVTDNYDKAGVTTKYSITNNGHSVQVNFKPHSVSTLTWQGTEVFHPLQFHLHWGKRNGVGSEHAVDGVHAEMELHIVHGNKKYDGLPPGEVLEHRDSLLVVGVFITVGRKTSPGLKKLVNVIKKGKLQQAGTEIPFEHIPVSEVVPGLPDHAPYWAYRGSLTTPPCSQVVRWIIMKEHLTITNADLKAFRSLLKYPDGTPIVNNFRPTQKMNGRKVYLVNQ